VTEPLVTVLVLTYNQLHLVDQALEGILAQRTDFDFRVLIHDDASTDGTQDRLRAVAADHPDLIELILQEENQLSQGVSIPARLLLRTHSEFVAFCEGDDYWTDPDKLQRQVDFLSANPWCTLCHHHYTILNDGGRKEYETSLRDYLASLPWRTDERVPGHRLAVTNFVKTCTAMVRRAAIRDRVLIAAHDVRPGDHIVFCSAAENGDVGFIDRDMATYRLHDQGSWGMLDHGARVLTHLGAYWFLAAHMRGPMQRAVQERLLHRLVGNPVLRREYSALRSLDDQIHELAGRVDELATTGTLTADALEAALGEKTDVERRLGAVTRQRDLLSSTLAAAASDG
jgi:glycosyltransferase involved in cell wall biosynthesis